MDTRELIRQAEGFWIYLDDEEVTADGEVTYFMAGQFSDTLDLDYTYGWNLIGTTVEGEKWSANNFLYSWDAATATYANKTGQVLVLGKGYWIFFMPPPAGVE